MNALSIDGLPAEFVLGKDGKPPHKTLMQAMPYTQSLLSNGMAIGYHAKAAPPTVTMPRLKVSAVAIFLICNIQTFQWKPACLITLLVYYCRQWFLGQSEDFWM